MPKLEAFFLYRNLDVSTLKELVKRWKPEVVKGMKKEGKHEALADIYESIEELKYYRKSGDDDLKIGQPSGGRATLTVDSHLDDALRSPPGCPSAASPCRPPSARACRPRPSTSTNRSEQPLMTFGWSVNSGTAFTMPSTFTTRFTLSRLPSSWRITASRSRPTERACW